MNLVARLVGTTLGKKYLMAATGLGMFLFAVVHMLGNLQVFLGPEAINHYAHLLKSNPEILWPSRLGLLACVSVHLVTAVALTLENRRARQQRYAVHEVVAATWASRTMLVSGLIVLTYVSYHLLHFTAGQTHPELMTYRDHEGRHDVYRMIVTGFRDPWVAGFYVLGVGLLSFHLSHGVGAMLQSLGLKNHAYDRLIGRLAIISALGLFFGYALVPVSVWAGWLTLP